MAKLISMKTALKICALILAAIFLKRFCYSKTDGFALYKIQSELTANPDWDVEEMCDTTLFDQPYHYLAKGAQSYVFLSEDGKTVIKFFRLYHLLPPLWLTKLSLPFCYQAYFVDKLLEKQEELRKDFESYKIAFHEMREETGLIYLHLNQTAMLNKTLTLVDKIGIEHRVSLDKMQFLVQKKADLVYPGIEKIVDTQGLEAAKGAITSLVSLLTQRVEKGIFDKDPDLNSNFGFLGTQAVQIDVGRFRYRSEEMSPAMKRDEILRITDNFRQWLSQNYPPLVEALPL
ncbi:MAG: hypothetical protein JSS61_04075 [Verrucomicrobia bacterium]|nr:hypothetical protein [Verrucomicrobiota bacterium]